MRPVSLTPEAASDIEASPGGAAIVLPTATPVLAASPTATPTATSPSEAPSSVGAATMEATAPVTPTPLSVSATPEAAVTPIDVIAELNARLPAILMGAIVVFGLVVLAAGVSILRGPRDI
ncbi:MAG: hypothetical protein CUN48_18470 [Candidatus Thermofonsia Clade 3 bacterium]|uniref:Uncharacterized protein n=1 Tax=Candidatus Thermofonsia Clade 3 bacterium TaxID=2364212 RepID=A0A2M8Q6W7_9CHLR|nr:MAG: hypothetical protein CUN48_18470 [Candidatus Thermofonsia Clade 3 bacterium]